MNGAAHGPSGAAGTAVQRMTETGTARIAAAFATAKGRAALMPYLMGGFPDIEASVAVATAYADAGADLVELGVPFSDPLADGPVIHAAATRALAAGATLHAVLEAAERIAELLPVVLMCYANPLFARGPERFAAELAQRGVSGLIVPDLPLEEGSRRAGGLRCPRDRARAARRPDHAGRAAGADRTDRAWICLHGLGDRDDRRAQHERYRGAARCWRA